MLSEKTLARRLQWSQQLVLQHRYDEAILYLADALELCVEQEGGVELEPSLARLYFEYGNSLLVRVENAESAISPEDSELAWNNLCIARLLLENHGGAACGGSAREAKSILARVLVRLGDHHALRGAHADAVEAYNAALSMRRDDLGEVATTRVVDIHTCLAQAHAARGPGGLAQARAHFVAALELAKDCAEEAPAVTHDGRRDGGGEKADWSESAAGRDAAHHRGAVVALMGVADVLKRAGISVPSFADAAGASSAD
eukprot:g81.t1